MKTDSAPHLPKHTKWLITLASAVLLYAVVGFFVVPAIIKSQLVKRLPALTKRQVAIDTVKCNPFVLSLTIDGFSLKETNGDVFSSFGELYVNFQLSSIFKGSWVFDEISLKDPFAQVLYLKDGAFNFANLINNPPAPAVPVASQKSSPPPPVIVYHLSITNGAVAFSDLTRKDTFKIRYQPINVNFTDFTTLRNEASPCEITAIGDSGETIGWSGSITVNPLRSSGAFRLTGLKLNKFKPYSQDYSRFEILDGQVDAGMDYRYDSTTNALDLEITNGLVALSRLHIKAPATGEDVLTIPSLTVKQIAVNLSGRMAEVGEIASSGGAVLVRRNHDGRINFLSSLIPQPKAAVSGPPGPAWTAKIDDVTLDNYTIKAEDQTPPRPATFNIDQLAVHLKNISNSSNAPVTLALNLRLQETGTVGLGGFATLSPPAADLLIGVTNLDLRMAQPYLDEQLKMAITRGALDVNGHAHYAADKPGVPRVAFAGDVSVRDFAVTDEVLFDELASWASLDITGINLALQPNKFQIDRIKVSKPSTTAILEADHRFNFLTIVPEQKTASANTNAGPASLPVLTLGEFVFDNASLHFIDRTIEPNCTFDIENSTGSFKDLSSLVATPSALIVKGNVDAFSSFSITGKMNPMPDKLYLDIAIAFTNTGLTAFSPYSAKYVGRPLEKGKLSLALHYRIEQKALQSSNSIFIDQLTLGAKNGSTNATKLPVKLAIALLKDRNGRILLDVPVQGRLDDPKFKLWPIIEQVIGNLITRIVTSPFSFLGSMFGGGPGLSYVAFDPGQSMIPPAESKKLDSLSKALYARPGLTLEINGSVDPAADRDEMARAKFQRQLKALFIKDRVAAGKPAVAVDELNLEPADYQRMVIEAYSNAFGTYQPPGTNPPAQTPTPPTAPTPVVTTPPAVQKLPAPARTRFTHGGSLLVFLTEPNITGVTPRPAPVLPLPKTNNPVSAAPAPVAVAPDDLTAMETRLMQKIVVTSDDFRQLMQERANSVEGYLLKTGRVTADRLFITNPKSIGANFHGEDRVNLTLD